MAAPVRFRCTSMFTPRQREKFGLEPDEGYECTGKCTRPLRAIRFCRERDPDECVILHPSTKYRGEWQLSWFDQKGPWGDTRVRDCEHGLAELLDRWYERRAEDGDVRPGFVMKEWG